MISACMVIIGMINGMIGSVILVIPLLALQAGTLLSFAVILISGIFSYYSCMICIKHLGPYSDLDEAIMGHFNQSIIIKVFYDFIVFLNLFLLLILYFELIVQQWEGMFPYSIANPLTNCIVLFALVFVMKYYDFGASLLAYGIISIIGYCIFLVWLVLTAPSGPNKMPVVGKGAIPMAATMGQAFSIQTFFIPVLRKNPYQSSYQLYTIVAYLFGLIINTYIAYFGSFGILQRVPVDPNPETVEGYFTRGHWQLHSLELIYLVHLYSVFPQFLLISKKRLFNIFQITQNAEGLTVQDIIYTILLISICLLVSIADVQIEDLIEINGAVIGFFFIYFLPIITHIKCLYFTTHTGKTSEGTIIEITPIAPQTESSLDQRALLVQKQGNGEGEKETAKMASFNCAARRGSIVHQILDGLMLLGMLIIGGFIMYDGIKNVFT